MADSNADAPAEIISVFEMASESGGRRVPHDPARSRAGVFPLLDEDLAVHDRELHASGVLEYPSESARVVVRLFDVARRYGVRVEQRQVRRPPGPDQAPIWDAEDGCHLEGQLAHRLFQGQKAALPHVLAQE